jgi:predicted alpha/beta-hydrolase family hydrolase
MLDSSVLRVTNARGAPLPNGFLRQEAGSDTLALLFPGRGYRASMPLLYYTQLALLERGADVLRLDLAYDLDPDFGRATPAERRAWIRDDALRAFGAASSQRDYPHVVLVGKSLGTWALTDILQGGDAPAAPRCVWLTPLLNDEALLSAVRERRPPSLFVIGTADPFYDASVLDELGALPGARSVVVPEADHGLVVPGNVKATLEAMGRYLSALEGFLDAAAAGA